MKTVEEIKRDILDMSQYANFPPTDKQAWYCAKLLSEHGTDFDGYSDGTRPVTGKQISQLIGQLIENAYGYITYND